MNVMEFLYILAIILIISAMTIVIVGDTRYIGKHVFVQNKEYIILRDVGNEEVSLAPADGSSNTTIVLKKEVVKSLINSKVEK